MSPGEQRREQGRTPIERLKVHQAYLLETVGVLLLIEDGVGDYPRTVDDGADPDPVVQQCIFVVPVEDFAGAESQKHMLAGSSQVHPEIVEALIEPRAD